jgi:hypothetical protein
MTTILALYLLNTILFSAVLVKQFLIIVRSPSKDEKLITKVVVFICCLAMMSAMWLCYFMIRGAAWFFFLMAIIVIVWVYKDEKFKN